MHILLITRHYPPEISGGARRPFLYVNALRKLGHRVTLVTPFPVDDEDAVCVPNPAIINGLARGDSDQAAPNKTPLTAIKNILRGWFFWPDPDIFWARNVLKSITAQAHRPDWIMTTRPPESINFAGAALTQKLGVTWLAEFRDTWTLHPHRQNLAHSVVRWQTERFIAESYLKHAAAITSVSDAVIAEARTYARKDTPECIIPHFSASPNAAFAFDSARLNLVHTGGFELSDHRRKLKVLIDALSQSGRSDFVLHIAGRLTPEEIRLAETAAITIECHGPVSLETSRALQAGADALILHTPDNSHALPGKYAEYAAAGRPIFYLGSGDWQNLVDTPNNLVPLTEGLANLEYGQTVQASSYMSDEDAALRLIGFLKTATP